jgi:hypothetical protein
MLYTLSSLPEKLLVKCTYSQHPTNKTSFGYAAAARSAIPKFSYFVDTRSTPLKVNNNMVTMIMLKTQRDAVISNIFSFYGKIKGMEAANAELSKENADITSNMKEQIDAMEVTLNSLGQTIIALTDALDASEAEAIRVAEKHNRLDTARLANIEELKAEVAGLEKREKDNIAALQVQLADCQHQLHEKSKPGKIKAVELDPERDSKIHGDVSTHAKKLGHVKHRVRIIEDSMRANPHIGNKGTETTKP